jgi:hypothetical protein
MIKMVYLQQQKRSWLLTKSLGTLQLGLSAHAPGKNGAGSTSSCRKMSPDQKHNSVSATAKRDTQRGSYKSLENDALLETRINPAQVQAILLLDMQCNDTRRKKHRGSSTSPQNPLPLSFILHHSHPQQARQNYQQSCVPQQERSRESGP